MVVFTRNFLPDKTSIKRSGMISSAKKLSIKSSTNLLECFLSHMYRQNANFGPCQAIMQINQSVESCNSFLPNLHG